MAVTSWIKAFRLRTLPLALACIGMGGFLAAGNGFFQWEVFMLAILTTILLQILSNLANDYGDSLHGADNDTRKGPSRAVQSGEISPAAMKRSLYITGTLALASGVGLLIAAFGSDWRGFLVFLGLGLASILAAVAYTNGKKPYGYLGLGDISVFIFFGLIGVLGSYYLMAFQLPGPEILPAISCGLFATGVLNVNNIRDIDSDKAAGKFSVPVRIGRKAATTYHWILLLSGWVAAIAFVILKPGKPVTWLFLLVLPLFFLNGINVARKPSEKLDPYLKQLAIATLIFVILFGIGRII